ncbi:uncharacterized protein LOC112841663 [Oreochromis niloticus]|uniref:uncharacterized protein LOC109202903 n=1 Tax=Oreochromis niloticus TaxID=8128 RepID=UPI000905BA8E|nr:uncharacterized protein LOC109202903 [Oreochromis niloticus]XP_019217128.1 uncharacterized protein LOC112841663 [Oreochromis niloticus]
MSSTTPTTHQMNPTSPIQSLKSTDTNFNMTTPLTYTSVETWELLINHFFGTIVPQWQSLVPFKPEYCDFHLLSTLLTDMLKFTKMLVRSTREPTENGDPTSMQASEVCLQSVGADCPEKTEDTGAKDSILNESSVDDHSDNANVETPGLEAQPALDCISVGHSNTQLETPATVKPKKSCMKKNFTADTKDFDKTKSCPLEKPVKLEVPELHSDTESLTFSSISPLPDSLGERSVEDQGETPGLEAQPVVGCICVDNSSYRDETESRGLKDEATPRFQGFLSDSESLTSSQISPLSDSLSEEKLCVNKVIQVVVSEAIDNVASKHKLFTERLTPDCIGDRLLEKIWPEINGKHLDLSPKSLKNIHKAILKDLCKTHKCKEKYLIFSLREQLDSITVPIFTKHLLGLPKRVLSVSKNRDEYWELVEKFTRDLVIHSMAELNETTTWHSGTTDFIVQRLSQKIWNKILSKNYKISLENIEELSLTVYNDLHEKWDSPGQFMKLSNPMVDDIIVNAFKKHAKLKRRNVISRIFSFAR